MPEEVKLSSVAAGPILVTGAAGFIGSHLARRLGQAGYAVCGCDNFNDSYDPALKRARVDELLTPAGVPCLQVDVAEAGELDAVFSQHRPTHVIHLAAQAGVRRSITEPTEYVRSNLVGFANVLEASRRFAVDHLVYASSSSVYGVRADPPFRETDPTDEPASFYAATKKANEAMAHAYGAAHGLRCTGLRLFTVYGPWGRPDMAYFSFARRLAAGLPLPVFAGGQLLRDFTFIDDVVEGIVRVALVGREDHRAVCEILNIGNHEPIRVLDFIATLAGLMGVEPKLEFLPMQVGDVPVTSADVDGLRRRVGFEPSTPLRVGLERFVDWFGGWQARSVQHDGT
jgi:UDP-glucuronate 4-epimerase